jgi:plasmid stabilization system protein ParE
MRWTQSSRTSPKTPTRRPTTVLDTDLAAAASLATLAERGRVVPESNNAAIREVFVFRYRLMYRVEDRRVIVVAFLHGAQDFAAWRQRQRSP